MEKISALIDGELEPDEAGRALSHVKQEPGLQDTWDTYHLIGDALRGSTPLSAGFQARLAQRLAAEPTVLAPQRAPARRIPTSVSYALSAAASLSAVAAVAWVALSGSADHAQPGLAQAPLAATIATPVAANPPPPAGSTLATVPVPEAVRAHDYLLAHQGVSPSTVLQGVAPYVRTVTVIQQTDGR